MLLGFTAKMVVPRIHGQDARVASKSSGIFIIYG